MCGEAASKVLEHDMAVTLLPRIALYADGSTSPMINRKPTNHGVGANELGCG